MRGLRRVRIPALAAGAALLLGACASSPDPVPAPQHGALGHANVSQRGGWQSVDGDNYTIGRFCDNATGQTVYATESGTSGYKGADGPGGGIAFGPAGCPPAQPNEFRHLGNVQNTDGSDYTVAELCDTANNTLLYVTESDYGGGVAAVPDGCAPGVALPGPIKPIGPAQNTDGSDYTVRPFCDRGTNDLLYVAESDYGGGIAVVPGGCPAGSGTLRPLSSQQQMDGSDYTLQKFCDVANKNLLYVGEYSYQGGIAVVPGGCPQPPAPRKPNARTPLPRPDVVQLSNPQNTDGDSYTVTAFRDGINGARLLSYEAWNGGSIAVLPTPGTPSSSAPAPQSNAGLGH